MEDSHELILVFLYLAFGHQAYSLVFVQSSTYQHTLKEIIQKNNLLIISLFQKGHKSFSEDVLDLFQ